MTADRSQENLERAATARQQMLERGAAAREQAAARRERDREQWQDRREASRRRQQAGVSRAIRDRDVSLLDLVDRLLDGGVVIHGDITLAVADVDLVYVGLRALISSVETIERDLGVSLTADSPSLRADAL
jgi:hypothetical protein